jgi:hypothetical protein
MGKAVSEVTYVIRAYFNRFRARRQPAVHTTSGRGQRPGAAILGEWLAAERSEILDDSGL